ncbi:MAG: LysM peptidoglycan-binding domain-containing protein [Chloroflexi bacterium]|nr:LysM peptidoglycan-binding domain-containing protein [Chloroflexota bacterium]
MSKKQRGLLVVFIFVVSTMLVSACEQSLSSPPAATPTLIPDGLFVSPFPTGENPMAMIEEFAKQTAAAQTAVAGGGTPATPGIPATAQVGTTGTVITPQTGAIATATSTPVVISTPTNANVNVPPAGTAVPPGTRPKEWVLQPGEWPYCIARRFDVDPDALLQASGLTSPDIYYIGQKLIIPQSGSFPGARNLLAHPTTYTASADDSVYGIACKFGDVSPDAIASANGISVSAKLTAGQQIKIP